MTRETYEQANNITREIEHIVRLLDFINRRNYECKPPIRNTSYILSVGHGDLVELNEGEMVTFRDALELKKEWLEKQFEML